MEELQFEAACVLTNIVSGDTQNTDVMISYGPISIFVKLLSISDKILKQAICRR